jgi:hypothetical protein
LFFLTAGAASFHVLWFSGDQRNSGKSGNPEKR